MQAGSCTPNYGPAPALPSGLMPLRSEMSSIAAPVLPPPPPMAAAGRSTEPQPSGSDQPPLELLDPTGVLVQRGRMSGMDVDVDVGVDVDESDVYDTPREYGTPMSTPSRASSHNTAF